MANTDWTDEALIAGIQIGGSAREEALKRIYLLPGLRETVIRHVLEHGGSRQDAQDIFQETLVLFDRNLREGRFEGKSALRTYFVAIAKWRWVTVRRQHGRYTNLAPAQYDAEVDSPEAETIRSEYRELFQEALGQIGERCRELLQLYQLEYSMEEIAQRMQYGNADVAKKEAYRCRMRFRELLENNPEFAVLLKGLT
ncbi:MAG: sigma-70 family RNA polymerase sigma factor [Saprospirales bacterium]|jgi:RNA polymerase sigma factor (sigma-70 family)|nr:sigma-70 family RNA polymerase sigma factor [Saprospirales bacterium]MBK8924069.1 sigma-70 family RNA polymerase sigma factor [Saprospirales bacterium]